MSLRPTADRFVFSSSVAADTWHPGKDPKAYEWWYFDALSDDGKEALVIVFLDNFIYSPRYNTDAAGGGEAARYPAVSFTYFANGKPVYRAESEFTDAEFTAKEGAPNCSIGKSGFRFDSASYGSGYLVSVELPMSRGRTVRANLEWLSIESNLGADTVCFDASAHCWNMVAPRSDVSGKITMTDAAGRVVDTKSFRGTGYHDHNLDNRWLASTVREWHWGRAHFADRTVVFCRYAEIGQSEPRTQLILIQDGKLERLDALSDEQHLVRDKFGIRYPTRLSIRTNELVSLETTPLKVIDSSFYHLRFLSSFKLKHDNSHESETVGITEFIAPRALRYRWLNWLSDLRTGRNGKGAVFR